jgi:hypothetical protein
LVTLPSVFISATAVTDKPGIIPEGDRSWISYVLYRCLVVTITSPASLTMRQFAGDGPGIAAKTLVDILQQGKEVPCKEYDRSGSLPFP